MPVWVPHERVKKGELDPPADGVARRPTVAEGLVGAAIEVHWPLDEAWYPGRVLRYSDKDGKHKVKYLEDQIEENVAGKAVISFPDPGKEGRELRKSGEEKARQKKLQEATTLIFGADKYSNAV